MVIGVVTLTFRLWGVESIKEKRGVARSLKQKLKNTFNVAVSEIASLNSRSVLEIGVVLLGPDAPSVTPRLEKIVNKAEAVCDGELADYTTELLYEGH